MSEFLNALQTTGQVACGVISVLLCLVGVVLSCLSISGTWLVLIAAGLLALVLDGPYPGIWTLIIFLIISIAVEVLEFLAGYWGITSKGGSKIAGIMAVIGGFIGMALGAFIPIPIIGPLAGMLAGSFLFAYMIERDRLKGSGAAVDIAYGAVFSRIGVIILKVCVTIGMIGALAAGLILAH